MMISGILALAALIFALGTGFGTTPVYLPVAAVLLTGIVFASRSLPTLMRFLIGLFSFAFIVLGVVTIMNEAGLIPDSGQPFLPPPHAAVVAAVLAVVNYVIFFVKPVRSIISLAAAYFETKERGELRLNRFMTIRSRESWIGLSLLAVIIGINVAQVYMNVVLSYWSNRFYTALQHKNVISFWTEILFFSVIATVWIIVAVYETYMNSWFDIRWRRWASERYIGRWLDGSAHYRMRLEGEEADNPDQRIAEDVNKFVSYTRLMYIRFFSAFLNIYAFVSILWSLSPSFPYNILGFDLSNIPGHLVWFSLLFSTFATGITHLIGWRLINLKFLQEKYEADFRFNLVRLRENAEQVALLNGELAERTGLMERLGNVVANTYAQMARQKKLTFFTAGYEQAFVVVPYFLLAPAYFASVMDLGALTQAAGAFSRVQNQFSLFINIYEQLADYRAITIRLSGFEASLARANVIRGASIQAVAKGDAIEAKHLNINLPNGAILLHNAKLNLKRAERTLLTGPSGAGKSTLFRVLAGIWPFASGSIKVPQGDSTMLLPQRPYMPLGTLRAALTYPAAEAEFSKAQIHEAMERIKLPGLISRLNDIDNWSDVLSGGEKQRVAIARALLRKPDWLFLDEATSALDEVSETQMYEVLAAMLPGTTLVSIGHRASLGALHNRRVAIRKGAGGAYLEDASLDGFASGSSA